MLSLLQANQRSRQRYVVGLEKLKSSAEQVAGMQVREYTDTVSNTWGA